MPIDGVRIEVRCIPKWKAKLRGMSGGNVGEDRSLRVKPSHVSGECGEGSKERRTESEKCIRPR